MFGYMLSSENKHAANTTANMTQLEEENVAAADNEASGFTGVTTLLMAGHMVVALTINEVEIQTWGKPCFTVDVMTPATALAFPLILPQVVYLTIILYRLRRAPQNIHNRIPSKEVGISNRVRPQVWRVLSTIRHDCHNATVISFPHNNNLILRENNLALPSPIRTPVIVGAYVCNSVSRSIDCRKKAVKRHAGVVSCWPQCFSIVWICLASELLFGAVVYNRDPISEHGKRHRVLEEGDIIRVVC